MVLHMDVGGVIGDSSLGQSVCDNKSGCRMKTNVDIVIRMLKALQCRGITQLRCTNDFQGLYWWSSCQRIC